MSIPARPKPKRDSATETARVLRVYGLLREELIRMDKYLGRAQDVDRMPLLEVADRIAARTEDPS